LKPSRRHLGLSLITLLASCSDPGSDRGTTPPVGPRVTAVLRATEIRIADRPEIDITVTTAPGQRVLRFDPPESLAGFEILDWRRLPVVREPRRWLHQHRVQLRALEIGRFEWPALQLTVVASDAVRTALELPPIPLEVGSVMSEHPNRTAPFGARAAPDLQRAERPPLRTLAAAAASLVLASATLLLFVRRRARKVHTRREAPPAPWNAAQREFDRAAELAASPTAASHRAAAALRGYMGRRFGARTRMHTSEELAAFEPPYGATSSWPPFVELLQDFDDLRFRPAGDEAGDRRSTAFASTLARARAFVEATTPPEGLR
jgi:hypothetical protein